jgi:hypothetical protein
MPKLTTTRHGFPQDRQHKSLADLLNNLKQPFDALRDFFICGGRQLSMQEIETRHEQIPVAEHPYATKRSRQAADDAARLSMEHHGWKQTGKKNSLWAFEHRWPHRRDHAEGRNHRLLSN